MDAKQATSFFFFCTSLPSMLNKLFGQSHQLIIVISYFSGHEKIQGIHPAPTSSSQKTENLRQCVSYLDLKGGDTHGIHQQGQFLHLLN